MYATILDDATKRVAVCEQKISEDFFEAEVEQDYYGNWYLKGYAPEVTAEDVIPQKLLELKRERNRLESQPIEYKGKLFDCDEHSRAKMNDAIFALRSMGEESTFEWTLYDGTVMTVTADDLENVFSYIGKRSNEIHIKYRQAKALVNNAKTANDVELVHFN